MMNDSIDKKNNFLKLLSAIFFFFFVINNVYADDYFRYGGTGEQIFIMRSNTSYLSTYDTFPAYRFTFVDANGSRIANTNSYDLLFQSKDSEDEDIYLVPWQIGGTYYKNFKFGVSNVAKKEITYAYPKPSDDNIDIDDYYMDLILDSIKSNNELIGLIRNGTGNTTFDKNEFLVVEKLYMINIKTAAFKRNITKAHLCDGSHDYFLEMYLEEYNKTFAEIGEHETKSTYCSGGGVDWGSNIVMVERTPISNYFVGTGLQVLKKLNDTEVNAMIGEYPVFGTTRANDGITTGLYWIKNSDAIANFVGTLKISNSSTLTELKTNGFNKTISVASGCAANSYFDVTSGFECALDVGKAYGINIFSYTKGGEEISCNSSTNADTLNRKWNSNGYCCLGGQTSSSCFTHDSVSNNDLNYTCQAQMNLCASGGVNSTLKSFSSGTDNGGNTLSATNSGECILNNSMYSYGNGIYCYETLSVSFSNVLNGISSPIPSGSFISIGKPATIVSRACYKKYNDNESKEPQFEKFINEVANLFNEKTGPDLSMNLFGNHSFKSNTKKVESTNVSLSIGDGDYIYTTSYGTNYMKATLSTAYTYNYSDGIYLNKFVDMKTATGSLNRTTAVDTGSYKTLIGDTNVSVPTDVTNYVTITEDGKKLVPVTYTIDGLQNLQVLDDFANLTSTKKTSYQYKKSDDCGGTCVVTYNNSNIGTAEKCSNEYNYLEKLYENSYDIKTTKNAIAANSCNFQFSFKTNSKAECDRAKGDGKGTYYQHGSVVLYSSYSKDTSCYDYLNFNNTNTGGTLNNNNSCSTKIEIEDDPPYDKLVYRPIDLSNPFPGKDGSGRKIGTNWNGTVGSGEKEITLVEKYITNRQDAYAKKPLYSFTLTPARIKKIREDNKKHPYDEFNLNCKGEGSECFSVFIATFKNYMNKEKSSCYFETKEARTKESFNSCADYSKR